MVAVGNLAAIQSQQWNSPGVVVCVEMEMDMGSETETDEEDEEVDEDVDMEKGQNGTNRVNGVIAEMEERVSQCQNAVREFWGVVKRGAGEQMGRGGIREVLMDADSLVKGQEENAVVRLWCEVLRLRA